ncbi:MAG TPA: serine/threonine-protein kinase [Byssovorax sp.]|jgi:serine/threonine-protein kinase
MIEGLRGGSVPRRIGRYDVVGLLATGGMAEVFLGKLLGPSEFERPVVIKRLLPHLARSDEFVQMFLDEARIVAGIRHGNVVHVHELCRDGDELFLVMEYVEGESVGGIMRRVWTQGETVGFALAAHVIAEACAGLHAAHELRYADGTPQDVVHRDVSPQNLMVTYDGQVKLLDFGIAKTARRVGHTEVGVVKGKSAYMSPEQCRGKKLDRRSDVFCLGTLLYELSTSRRLFYRASDLATMTAITKQAAPRPSDVVAGYPAELEAVCLRALAKSPEDRYPTAAAMRRDLVAALRVIAGGDPLEEAAATLMQRVFADRIAEKAEMIRSVVAGAAPATVVPAEVDAAVELPWLDETTALRLPGDAQPTGESGAIARVDAAPGAKRPIVAALAAALVLAAGVVWTARAASPGRPPTAAATVAASTSTPRAPADSASESSAAAKVVLHVESAPPGASVTLAGRELGVTPLDAPLPASSARVELVIASEGFAPSVQEIALDANVKVMVTLTPHVGSSEPASSAAPTPARRRGAAPAKSGDPFFRFD